MVINGFSFNIRLPESTEFVLLKNSRKCEDNKFPSFLMKPFYMNYMMQFSRNEMLLVLTHSTSLKKT